MKPTWGKLMMYDKNIIYTNASTSIYTCKDENFKRN